MTDLGRHYLDDAIAELRKYKKFADKAVAQVSDADYFRQLDPESNSVGLVMKHIAGNLRSRWTDFLTTDGEKADRNRDTEFEKHGSDSRESISARWESGWQALFDALAPLTGDGRGGSVGEVDKRPHAAAVAEDREAALADRLHELRRHVVERAIEAAVAQDDALDALG